MLTLRQCSWLVSMLSRQNAYPGIYLVANVEALLRTLRIGPYAFFVNIDSAPARPFQHEQLVRSDTRCFTPSAGDIVSTVNSTLCFRYYWSEHDTPPPAIMGTITCTISGPIPNMSCPFMSLNMMKTVGPTPRRSVSSVARLSLKKKQP